MNQSKIIYFKNQIITDTKFSERIRNFIFDYQIKKVGKHELIHSFISKLYGLDSIIYLYSFIDLENRIFVPLGTSISIARKKIGKIRLILSQITNTLFDLLSHPFNFIRISERIKVSIEIIVELKDQIRLIFNNEFEDYFDKESLQLLKKRMQNQIKKRTGVKIKF